MQPIIVTLICICTLLHTTSTHAYIGPGTGLGAIGTVIAFLAAVLLLIIGFIWYPVKRFLQRRKSLKPQSKSDKKRC
jgi:uncharacterized membrane protein YccC